MFYLFSRRHLLKRAASLIAVATAGPVAPALAQTRDSELEALARAFAAGGLGQVVGPGHAEHRRITFYNGRFDCVTRTTYIRPTSTAGAQQAVAFAIKHRRKFAIRGAGHSFEGKSSHPDLVIDMAKMTKLAFDKANSRLVVEAGVQLGAVYKVLGAAGHVLPAGTCPTVGIVGHALGGGIGDFLPMFGLAAQSMISATMVTLRGDVIKVSDDGIEMVARAARGDDDASIDAAALMTALRGGGQGAFGVVTEMTFKTYNVKRSALAAFNLSGAEGVTAERAAAILETWMAWRDGLPTAMQSMVSSKVNLSRASDGYSLEMFGLIVAPAEAGVSVAAIRQVLEPLFKLADFKRQSFKRSLSVPAAIKTFLDDDETTHNPARKKLYGSSSLLEAALPPVAIKTLLQRMETNVFASLYTAGGAVGAGPATALHGAAFIVEWSIYSERLDGDAARKLRSIASAVTSAAGARDLAFPNYPDGSARDYFRDANALAALRRKLDPNELSTSSLLGGPRTDDGCG